VQLWAETYNRELGDTGPFETLDDVTDRIVATVAGGHGVLVRSMATATREKPLEEAGASQLVSQWFTYVLQLKAEEHARLRAAFKRVLNLDSRISRIRQNNTHAPDKRGQAAFQPLYIESRPNFWITGAIPLADWENFEATRPQPHTQTGPAACFHSWHYAVL
jgi:hypothetical protein